MIHPEACQSLINLARGQLTPATVVGESGLEFSQIRISNLAWFYHNHNEVVESICKQVAEIVEQPIHYADNLQVAHYGVGGKFEPHLDCYDIEQETYKAFLERSGQRLYTALFYLNDVVSGGETYFPYLNIEVSPTTGTLLIFENCQSGTSIPDQRSLHGSKILQGGEKWIGTLWFCDRPQYQV